MIIGITGGMGCGKSTAVETLVFGTLDTQHKIRLVKLAQPLYDMQEFIYRRIDSAYARPKDFVKDRKLLQYLGTDWGRNEISSTIFIDLWKAEALRLEKEGYVVACDDVRFDNEAEVIRELGGKVIQIKSDNVYAKGRIASAKGFVNHPSENGISKHLVDFIVENNNTRTEYQDKLLNVFKQILTPIKVQKLD